MRVSSVVGCKGQRAISDFFGVSAGAPDSVAQFDLEGVAIELDGVDRARGHLQRSRSLSATVMAWG